MSRGVVTVGSVYNPPSSPHTFVVMASGNVTAVEPLRTVITTIFVFVVGDAYRPKIGSATVPSVEFRSPLDIKFAFVYVAEIGVVVEPDFGVIENEIDVNDEAAICWRVTVAIKQEFPLKA